jgi:tRNA(fMet)-specific endonuclease VapC
MVHLDTSFLVDLLREQAKRSAGPATRWLEAHAATPLEVSIFVECELEAGAAAAHHPAREREKLRHVLAAVSISVPGASFAARYGATLAGIHRASKAISTMDLLIATSALERGAPLVTANRRHFEVVPDLEVLAYK